MPGANFLHCIEQTESAGGFSLISDGFYAAEKLKLNYPELFDVLSTTLVDWSDVGEEDGNKFHSINRAPVIWYKKFVFINKFKTKLVYIYFKILKYWTRWSH